MPENKPYVKIRLVCCKIAGVVSTDRCYLLRPGDEPGRRHEHQRRSLHLPYQHDLPECVRCHQRKYLSHSLSAGLLWRFWIDKIFQFYLQFMNILSSRRGPGSSVGIATELPAGGSGIEYRCGRDFPPVQTGLGAHPASCTMGTGSFPGVKCGRGVLLTTYPLLVPRSWKSRAIPLPTVWATLGL